MLKKHTLDIWHAVCLERFVLQRLFTYASHAIGLNCHQATVAFRFQQPWKAHKAAWSVLKRGHHLTVTTGSMGAGHTLWTLLLVKVTTSVVGGATRPYNTWCAADRFSAGGNLIDILRSSKTFASCQPGRGIFFPAEGYRYRKERICLRDTVCSKAFPMRML